MPCRRSWSAVSALCVKSLLPCATRWELSECMQPDAGSGTETPPCRMQVPAISRGRSLCIWRTTMSRLSRLLTLVALVALVIASGARAAHTSAEMSTPAAGGGATLLLIEHADLVTEIDLGEPGASVGDMLVWGPNALYDDANDNDTGATTQGTCIAFNAPSDCLAAETILFPDGSTLEFQGIERGGAPAVRTIVGGSGRYLSAIGTMTAAPTADLKLWT